jgi:hypothetical protein
MRPHTKITHTHIERGDVKHAFPILDLKVPGLEHLQNDYAIMLENGAIVYNWGDMRNDQLQNFGCFKIMNPETGAIVTSININDCIYSMCLRHDGSVLLVTHRRDVLLWEMGSTTLIPFQLWLQTNPKPWMFNIVEYQRDCYVVWNDCMLAICDHSTNEQIIYNIPYGVWDVHVRDLLIIARSIKSIMIYNRNGYISTIDTENVWNFNHKWNYPIMDLWRDDQMGYRFVRTKQDRKEWAKILCQFLWLLPDLWNIVAMYD